MCAYGRVLCILTSKSNRATTATGAACYLSPDEPGKRHSSAHLIIPTKAGMELVR